jgi:hypothetical protein
MTLVISSWSDSIHVSTRIAFSNCVLQSSQIWRRCQNFCFEIFSADSRMATCCGVSTTWWSIYCASVIAPSTRWCLSTVWTCSDRFRSIAGLLGIFSFPTLESLPIMEPLIKSLKRVACLELTPPFGTLNEDFQSYHVGLLPRWDCEGHPFGSYLGSSCSKLGRSIAWASLSSVVFRCCAFLLNSLKSDDMNHVWSK